MLLQTLGHAESTPKNPHRKISSPSTLRRPRIEDRPSIMIAPGLGHITLAPALRLVCSSGGEAADVLCHIREEDMDACARALRCLLETGDVVRHSTGLRGRPRQFQFEDIDYLLRVIKHRPDWFLDELQMLLQTNRFVAVHFTTIYRALERARVSRKKLKKIAAERDEEKRANFIRRMAQYTPEQLGFLDEVSKDERTGSRRFGRAGLGARAVKKGVFIRGRRFSAEGLLTIDGMGIASQRTIERLDNGIGMIVQ
ncbi:hypothetical protein D9611_013423 [Ephemerocybe angulata]|uniref:Transposase n=1 Tax=Ephemerocybe angulata TaxID=980116 RepID=A0A8H5BUJ0_9AGAR|nr:hypothetical protein D9611_013423 [Tulosesus angulatus]